MSGEVALSNIDRDAEVAEVQNGDKGADKSGRTYCPKEECASSGYFKRSYSLGVSEVGLGLLRSCVAEFFGTFFLILFCVGAANSWVLIGLGQQASSPLYYLAIAISFGLGIGGIVHILGEASGGHVNPAVSLALLLDKRISLIRCICYIVAQFIGGFAGAGALYGLGNHKALVVGELNSIAGTNSFDTAVLNYGQAFFIEVLGTMFLVLTILSTIEEKRGHASSYLQPLAIGIAILVMHIWMIPYTNCAINPVRGIVWNIVAGKNTGTQILVFLFAPLVGGIVAVPLYNLIFA